MARLPAKIRKAANRDIVCRFGMQLRGLRLQRNLTQAHLAEMSGLDRSFVSDLERGRRNARLETLEIIANTLKISLGEMMDGL